MSPELPLRECTGAFRVLLVEDSETDAKLVLHEVGRTFKGVVHERVQDAAALREALSTKTWDIILSDWSMPRFNGRASLALARELAPDIPFILVSATVGEEEAVEAIRAGADDYVIKDRLGRLVPAIERALRDYESRRERRTVEEALRRSDARFRRLSDSGIVGIVIADVLGNVSEANPTALAMFGYTAEEARAMPWTDMIPADWQQIAAGITSDLIGAGFARPREIELFRKGGTRVPILLGAAMIEYPECIVFVADLTERKRTEASLSLAESRKADLVDAALDAIVTMGPDGKIIDFNPAAERTFGYVREEVVGKRVGEVIVPPRMRLAHEEGAARFFATGNGKFAGKHVELVALRRDGTEIPVEISIARIGNPTSPICTAFIRDITERKRAEEALRSSEQLLRQAQKMEAVGRLAGGIAHDFNNILSVILSYTSLILEDPDIVDPLKNDLQEIELAGRRASELTTQLLAFSRQQVLKPQVIDLTASLSNVERMLGRVLGEDIVLTTTGDASVWPIKADPGQIEQIMMNLAVNARDAMPNGGSLRIEIKNVDLDGDTNTGPHVMLAVRDDGIGMDEATQARIFEPFFTTKPVGKGTGLGLSTVLGIVEQSGGFVRVESKPGGGTTFRIYFPRTDETEAPVSIRLSGSPAKKPTETILLVEDNAPLRQLIHEILTRRGYVVLDAAEPHEALRQNETHHGQIHLLLTDVVLPTMNGRLLAERIRSDRDSMKVLYMSGYTDDVVLRHGSMDQSVTLLQKPITPHILLSRVREALDASPTLERSTS